jgi:hypothetical protein
VEGTVMISAHAAFEIAGSLYGLAFFSSLLPARRQLFVFPFLIAAILVNGLVVFLRYNQAWPMLPMHLAPVALPLCLALLYPMAARANDHDQHRSVVRRYLLGLNLFFIILALCFPKDFYLPFLKSKSLFAHAFLLFSVLGKGCFVVCGIWAAVALGQDRAKAEKRETTTAMSRSLLFAAWGFVLWTLAMFSGEIWCYIGWGAPVVWEDAAITTTMAAWFFYACYLHLHFSRAWSQMSRAILASGGGFAVLILTCLPDFGPFRPLF